MISLEFCCVIFEGPQFCNSGLTSSRNVKVSVWNTYQGSNPLNKRMEKLRRTRKGQKAVRRLEKIRKRKERRENGEENKTSSLHV